MSQTTVGALKIEPTGHYIWMRNQPAQLLVIYNNGYNYQDPRVLDAMLPYYASAFGNPHSRTHAYGWECEEAVETARKVISTLSRLC